MTAAHPGPELLVPFALGADDPATARHVGDCPTCQLEIEALQESSGLLRGGNVLEHRNETPDCPDELTLADFVDSQLTGQSRAAMVAHLLTCARCRALVKATSELAAKGAADATPQGRRRWQRWALPVGVAAAAALALLLLPRGDGESPDLREPAVTSTIAPVPLLPAPGSRAAHVDRLLWSSVPGAERYRVRVYDGEGSVLWMTEISDTIAMLPDSVRLQPRVLYFWRVEAQGEWMRWAASDLASFQIDAR